MSEEAQIAAPAVEVTTTAPAQTNAEFLNQATAAMVESESTPVEQAQEAEKVFKQSEVDKIVQTRLAKESRRLAKVAELEVENRMLRERLTPRQEASQSSGEPDPNQFQDTQSYIRAMVEYGVSQTLKKQAQEREAFSHAEKQRTEAERIRAALSKASEKYADFDEVIGNPNLPITETMKDVIADSDHGGEIAYYLGTHHSEAEAIAKLSPGRQARAILDLEKKISQPPPSHTKTPPPIVPGGTRSTIIKPLTELSQSEFEKRRNAFRAARRA